MKIVSFAAVAVTGLVLSGLSAVGCATPTVGTESSSSEVREAKKDSSKETGKSARESTTGERPTAGNPVGAAVTTSPIIPRPVGVAPLLPAVPVTTTTTATPSATTVSQCVVNCVDDGRGTLNECSVACGATCSVTDPNCDIFNAGFVPSAGTNPTFDPYLDDPSVNPYVDDYYADCYARGTC